MKTQLNMAAEISVIIYNLAALLSHLSVKGFSECQILIKISITDARCIEKYTVSLEHPNSANSPS